MKKSIKKIVCLLVVFVFVFSISILSGCSKRNYIVVGAKDFTEQDILGNLVTLLLENNTDEEIVYKHEMSSNVLFAAIKKGEVDICIDYTGTIYGNYLNYSDIKSAEEVYDIAKKEMSDRFKLSVLDPIGFNNTYCLAVTPEIAQQYKLSTYSDLAKVSKDFVFGGTFEILNRNDGIPNLKIVYDMEFKDELALEGVLRYEAIDRGDTQVTEAFSTDGMLKKYDLKVLEDDKSFFPPYHSVPIINDSAKERYPELVVVLEKLTDLIDDETMRELNYKVDVLQENPKEVAKEFLEEKDLI